MSTTPPTSAEKPVAPPLPARSSPSGAAGGRDPENGRDISTTPPTGAETTVAQPLPSAPEADRGPGPAGAPGGRDPAVAPPISDPILTVDGLSLWYGDAQALHDIALEIPRRMITAFIGPSGCGKSTLLRCFNRMNDLVDGVTVKGDIHFDGSSVFDARTDVNGLRKRIGMVFQKSNPFPKSIYDNIAYGPRLHGVTRKRDLDEIVERSLRSAALWDEVQDRLGESALGMSGGQQQRLCIARAIAIEPEVILLDEPCSALDPIATARIEELMQELIANYTLVIVTHNMQQASRVSDYTAFLYLGRVIEYGKTEGLFLNPMRRQTEDYITGRFG